jgi:hypothetical protein
MMLTATAEFATLRLRLLKLGARIIETASLVRPAFAGACPEVCAVSSTQSPFAFAEVLSGWEVGGRFLQEGAAKWYDPTNPIGEIEGVILMKNDSSSRRCSLCGGSGVFGLEKNKCPECGGSGRLQFALDDDIEGNTARRRLDRPSRRPPTLPR